LTTAQSKAAGRALVTLDLDRTLIYSAHAIAEGASADVTPAPAQCVEIYQGRPQSFMSPRAITLLTELATVAHVVPTTTRTIEQYRRIELPIGVPHFAITSNGGNILVDGHPDIEWTRRVSALLDGLAVGVEEVFARLSTDATDAPWLRTMRIADGLFCYVVAELDLLPPEIVPAWASWAAELGWNVSRQGRKIYVMPDPVTKQLAINEVRNRLVTAPDVSFAAGDGVLDQPMLVAADASIRPRHGELEELGWRHPNVAVTEGRGLAASEEMLTWLLERTGTMVGDAESDIPAAVLPAAGGAQLSTPNEGLR
jgi:hydroxymethylpyrimidine pyrophosphatase-like HAD family hydrolase